MRLAFGLAALFVVLVGGAAAQGVDADVTGLQHDWEVIRFQTPAAERARRFEALAERAHQLSGAHPERADALLWEGIIVDAWAGERGRFIGLGLARQARTLYETVLQQDAAGVGATAYACLGTLYARVPGWPLGFGDRAKAEVMLQKALALDPAGLDTNLRYGEFLLDAGRAREAVSYLERALKAPLWPGHHVADTGWRAQARSLIERARLAS